MPRESKRAVEQGQVRENTLEHQCLCRLECIQGIITPRVSPYVARSIPPVFLRMGVRVALQTVTTTCDFKRGGATKPIIGSS